MRLASALVFAAVLLIGCVGSQGRPSEGHRLLVAAPAERTESADFIVDERGEQFVVRLVTADQIKEARSRLGEARGSPVGGSLLDGDGCFNRDVAANRVWPWRLDPRSVAFQCPPLDFIHGRPSDVQAAQGRDPARSFNGHTKRYCANEARFVSEILAPAHDWSYCQDFSKSGDWDAAYGGCEVGWCGARGWHHLTGIPWYGALKVEASASTTVMVRVDDRDFSQATLRFKYYQAAAPGNSKLYPGVGKDEQPICDMEPRARHLDVIRLDRVWSNLGAIEWFECMSTVPIGPGDTAVYWKFEKGPGRNILIVDDLSVTLTGSRKHP